MKALRGFDRKVVRANFFRSVLAWPLATAFAPLGNLLAIPSIVQAKIWSDVVAGFIEGGGKYLTVLRLRRRDLEEIVPRLSGREREERFTALLDLLFLYREEPRTASSLKAIFDPDYRPMGVFRNDPKARKHPFGPFCAAVMDDGSDHELVDFILARNTHESAVDLANLVSETLPSLRDWLAAQARSMQAQDQVADCTLPALRPVAPATVPVPAWPAGETGAAGDAGPATGAVPGPAPEPARGAEDAAIPDIPAAGAASADAAGDPRI